MLTNITAKFRFDKNNLIIFKIRCISFTQYNGNKILLFSLLKKRITTPLYDSEFNIRNKLLHRKN